MASKNNLKSQGWFAFYRGMVYRNRPLDVHNAINNKVLIDREIQRGDIVASLPEIKQRYENSGWSEKST